MHRKLTIQQTCLPALDQEGREEKKKKLLQLQTLYASRTHRPPGRNAGTETGVWADPEPRSNHASDSQASFPHTSCRSPSFSPEHSAFQEMFPPSPSLLLTYKLEKKQGGKPFFSFLFFFLNFHPWVPSQSRPLLGVCACVSPFNTRAGMFSVSGTS